MNSKKNISTLIKGVMNQDYTLAKDSVQKIIDEKLQKKIRQELKYLKENNK
jgi:hypothetical protein